MKSNGKWRLIVQLNNLGTFFLQNKHNPTEIKLIFLENLLENCHI